MDFAALGGKNIRASQMSSTPSANLFYFATLHGGANSTSSLAIGTGSKTFTVASGLSIAAGMPVRASSRANGANFMEGSVTSYSGTSLVVNVTAVGGSGTFADWDICPFNSSETTYSATNRLELATAAGYTAGGKTCGTMSATGNVLDCPDVVWSHDGGGTNLGPASYGALWVNTTNSIAGAQLVGVKDNAAAPATASGGGTMTFPFANPLTMN